MAANNGNVEKEVNYSYKILDKDKKYNNFFIYFKSSFISYVYIASNYRTLLIKALSLEPLKEFNPWHRLNHIRNQEY